MKLVFCALDDLYIRFFWKRTNKGAFLQFELSQRTFVAMTIMTKAWTLWGLHIVSIFCWVCDRDENVAWRLFIASKFISQSKLCVSKWIRWDLTLHEQVLNTQTHITFTSNETSYELVEIYIYIYPFHRVRPL